MAGPILVVGGAAYLSGWGSIAQSSDPFLNLGLWVPEMVSLLVRPHVCIR